MVAQSNTVNSLNKLMNNNFYHLSRRHRNSNKQRNIAKVIHKEKRKTILLKLIEMTEVNYACFLNLDILERKCLWTRLKISWRWGTLFFTGHKILEGPERNQRIPFLNSL